MTLAPLSSLALTLLKLYKALLSIELHQFIKNIMLLWLLGPWHTKKRAQCQE